MNYILLTQQGGILKPFAWALGKVFEIIYSMLDMVGIESIGLCIIIFPIIVRLFLLPSAIKQQKFTKLNALISPEITKIQNKYKGKKDQQSQLNMNAEIQAVYDKYGVSPAGSCLQLIIQMPILFALYRVIYNVPAYVGQVKEYYLTIINHLSPSQLKEYFNLTVDSVDKLTGTQINNIVDSLYGYSRVAKDFKLPEGVDLASIVQAIGNPKTDAAFNHINQINKFLLFDLQKSPQVMYSEGVKIAILIPVLAGLTQFILSKITMSLNKTATTKEMEENPMMSSMKTMNYVMPLMSMFMTWGFASALGIYWVASSTIMLIQQIGLNIYFKNISIDDIIAESKEKAEKKRAKRGFTANMISNAAAMNASLNENNNNNNSDVQLTRKQKEEQYEKAMEKYNSSISSDKNSISARANMVRDFENRKK